MSAPAFQGWRRGAPRQRRPGAAARHRASVSPGARWLRGARLLPRCQVPPCWRHSVGGAGQGCGWFTLRASEPRPLPGRWQVTGGTLVSGQRALAWRSTRVSRPQTREQPDCWLRCRRTVSGSGSGSSYSGSSSRSRSLSRLPGPSPISICLCPPGRVQGAPGEAASGVSIPLPRVRGAVPELRSEERRVGKECLRLCRSRWSPYH